MPGVSSVACFRGEITLLSRRILVVVDYTFSSLNDMRGEGKGGNECDMISFPAGGSKYNHITSLILCFCALASYLRGFKIQA